MFRVRISRCLLYPKIRAGGQGRDGHCEVLDAATASAGRPRPCNRHRGALAALAVAASSPRLPPLLPLPCRYARCCCTVVYPSHHVNNHVLLSVTQQSSSPPTIDVIPPAAIYDLIPTDGGSMYVITVIRLQTLCFRRVGSS